MHESVAPSKSETARKGSNVKAKSCARCGKRLPADPGARVYSHFSHSYFCANIAACAKRARRKRRAGVAA